MKSLYILTKKCLDRHKKSRLLISVIPIWPRYPKLKCFLYFMNETFNTNVKIEKFTNMLGIAVPPNRYRSLSSNILILHTLLENFWRTLILAHPLFVNGNIALIRITSLLFAFPLVFNSVLAKHKYWNILNSLATIAMVRRYPPNPRGTKNVF